MALEKAGYSAAVRGTSQVNIGIDEDGNIATSVEDAVGTKRFSINKVNADNSLADNQEVLEFFITLANGTCDSLSNTMSVKWGV